MHIAVFFVALVTALAVPTRGLPILGVKSRDATDTDSQINPPPIAAHHPNTTVITIRQCPDGLTTGKHIVTVRDGLPRTHILGLVASEAIDLDYVNSIVGYFDEGTLETIQARSDVSYITQECFMDSNISTSLHSLTQTNSPWGLARLSSIKRLSFTPATKTHLSYTYYSAGTCADVYVVDSGINTQHLAFQGRAHWGASFGDHGPPLVDELGHGTHIAGIIGSSLYGVAKGTRLIAVKVLGKNSKVVIGDILRGLEWVLHNSKKTNRPSVVNLSFSANGNYPELDRAVQTLVNSGIHVVVSAGNLNKDARDSSPAHLPSVITVASSTVDDSRAADSNYGDVVDIFAPGDKIMSTWIGTSTATSVKSGTSMAAPHVSGWLAYFICLEPRPPTPAEMQKKLMRYSLNGVLSNIPKGTPNRLAHIPVRL